MATTVARLEAVLSADTSKFDRDIDQSKGKMSKMGKVAGAAGLAIFAGLGVMAKRGFDEIKESQKVMAQTEAGIKSTGGAAKVTAKDMEKLTGSLSKMSGVDDEVIQQGANLLLTFTKVRNEVGRGSKIFDRATQSALDLSVKGFGSVDSASKMLGKALNDPVRGLTALNRAGVQFTDIQKDQIKALVEGRKAHEAIFDVYEGKVTPAMITQAKELSKAGQGWEEIAESLNLKFTPAQQTALTEMTKGGKYLEAHKIILKEVETQVGGSAKAYGDTLPGQMAKAKNAFDEMAAKIMIAVLPAMTAILQKLQVAVEWLDKNRGAAKALVIGLALLAVGMIALSLAQALVAIGATAMWAALTAGLIIAIPALVAGFILLYKKSETFRDIVDAVIGVMRTLWAIFLNVTPIGLIIKHFDTLKESLERVVGVFQRIANWINRAYEHLKDFAGLLDKIKGPSGLDFLKGDPKSPNFMGPPGGGTGPMDVSPKLWDELGGARRFGLTLTSGYRPGAVTRSGTPSDHGIYPSHAIDVAGAPSAMAGFFRWLIGQRDVKQAFYDPLGSIFGGMLSSYREGGHSDHVHVATADSGFLNLRPGWNMVGNFTGRNEPMSAGGTYILNAPNYVGSKEELFTAWREMNEKWKRRNGG